MAIGKITSKSLAADAVTSANLAPGAVTISDIPDSEITADKLHTTLDLSTKTLTLTQASVTAHESALTVTQSQISDLSTTSDLAEGTNLYYTDARADARAQLKVDALVGAAPGTLDTLEELGDALGDDPNFATTVTNSIADKLPLAGGTLTGNLNVTGTIISTGIGGFNNYIDLNTSGNRGKIGYDNLNLYIGSTSSTGEIHFKNNISSADAPQNSGDTKMVITDSGVGIGYNNPQNSIHVLGNSSIPNVGLTLQAHDTVNAIANINLMSRLADNNNKTVELRAYRGNLAILGDSGYGNVGIGYTSPNEKLHVNGYIEASSGFKLASHPVLIYDGFDGGYATQLGSTGTSTLDATQIFAGGSLQATFKGGKVGIGTSLPNSPLEVSNGTENHRIAFGAGEVYLMARNASAYINQEYIANQHIFTGYGDNSSNEAMRIDSSGHVMIGTTTNSYGTGKFTIRANPGGPATSGNSTTNVGLRIATNSSNSQSLDFGVYNGGAYGSWIQAKNSGDSSNYPIVLNPNGGKVGIGRSSPDQTLDVDGDIRIADARSLFFQRNGDAYAWRMRNESAQNNSTYGFGSTNKLVFEVVSNSNVSAVPSDTSHNIYPSSTNTLVLTEYGRVGIGTDNPYTTLHVNGPSAYGGPKWGTWTESMQTFHGGQQTVRIIEDHTGRWIVVGRWDGNASSSIQGTWSSVSGLSTSLDQNNQTAFSSDFGSTYPTECRFLGSTDWSNYYNTRTIDFIHGIPVGRPWELFMSNGDATGMGQVTGSAGGSKYGWTARGAYDGFGRWSNPNYLYHKISDTGTAMTHSSNAFRTPTSNAFNWNPQQDAKVTVNGTGLDHSGQDVTASSGFGRDDSYVSFYDEYPTLISNFTSNNAGGGAITNVFSSAVWVLIKMGGI